MVAYDEHIESLNDFFTQNGDLFGKFELVEPKRSSYRDLHAFLLLEELSPGGRYIISGTGHEIFWLNTDCARLYEQATRDQLIELIQCGVLYDCEEDVLYMFA